MRLLRLATFTLEPRPTTPAWLNLALPVVAVLATLVLCSGLIALAGAPVLDAYGIMFAGALGGRFNVVETLVKAAPMIFTGLAVAVAFRAKFWNIGAEGQLYAGAVAATYVGSFPMPGLVAMPAMALAGAAAGAAVALIPAALRVKLKVDDVVSSLLLNSIVILAVMTLIEGPWKDPFSGYPISPPIEDSAGFPRLLAGTRLHLGVAAAVLAAVGVWFLLARTTLGFRIKVIGENPQAARFAGIGVARVLVAAALISGALAGLAGVNEIGGVQFQVMSELSPGFGYSGIVIAMLARLNPLGVVPAAIFFAVVMTGAEAMSRATGVPVFLADVIQGTALLTMLVALLFTAFRLRRAGMA
jgi:simple sugar transport system permease protein